MYFLVGLLIASNPLVCWNLLEMDPLAVLCDLNDDPYDVPKNELPTLLG